jgi:hypothetical protein
MISVPTDVQPKPSYEPAAGSKADASTSSVTSSIASARWKYSPLADHDMILELVEKYHSIAYPMCVQRRGKEHVLMVQFSPIPLAVFHCASTSATVHDRPSTLHDSHGRLCYCRGEAKTFCGLEVAPLSDPFPTNSNNTIKGFLSRCNRCVSYRSVESARIRVQTGQSAHGDCMYPIWGDFGAPDASRGIRCTRRQRRVPR